MAKELIFSTRVETGKALEGIQALKRGIVSIQEDQKKLNKALRTGAIDQGSFAKATAKNDVALKNLRGQYREATNAASGLNEAGLRFRDKIAGSLTQSLKTVGKQVAVAFGAAALIRGFINAVGNARDIIVNFESAIAKLQGITQASDEQIESLTDKIKELGSTTIFTATQVADAATELAKLGLNLDETEAALEGVLDGAVALGVEIPEAAKLVAGSLNAFNLEAEESNRVVATLAAATTNSALDFQKLEVSLSNSAAVASQYGLTIEETAGSLGVLVDNNLQATKAGTQFRNILLTSQKEGVPYQQLLDKITKSSNQGATAVEIFGKENATAAILLANNSDAVKELTGDITGQDAALKKLIEERLDTVEGKTKLVTSAWEGFILSIDEGNGPLSGAAKSALDLAAGILQFATEASTAIGESEAMSESFGTLDELGRELKEQIIQLFESLGFLNEEGADTEVIMNALSRVFDVVLIPVKLVINAVKILINGIRLLVEAGKEAANFFGADFETNFKEPFDNLVDAGGDVAEAFIKPFRDRPEEIEKTKEATEDLTKSLRGQTSELDSAAESTKKLTAAEMERLELLKEFNAAKAKQNEEGLKAIPIKAKEIEQEEQGALQQIESGLSIDERFEEQRIKEEERELTKKEFLIDTAQTTADAIFTIGEENRRARLERETDAIQARVDAGTLGAEEGAKQIEEVERQSFKKKKTADIAQAIINGALGVTKVIGQTGIGAAFAVPAVIASTAAQVAVIANQKFADGGIVNGPDHSKGGVKFAVGGMVNELEGGEAVINKRSTARFKPVLSAINASGGGKKFQDGGVIEPTSSDIANADISLGLSNLEMNPVVSVVDIRDADSRVTVAEQNAEL